MSVLWQQILVAGALLIAVAYLARHFYRRRKAETGCKSCPTLKTLAKKSSPEEKTSSV